MWDPYAEFQSATLSNGLTVHAAHWPGRPWEAMGFLIHSGAEHDPVGLEGLAHFVEHLVSENTNVSKKEMHAFFKNCGGEVHLGTTGYPSTRYRFFLPAEKIILARAFSIFSHMLLSAKLEKFIERERQVIIREFYNKYPARYWFDLDVREHKALYTGYWLERFVSPLGNPESVERIAQSDLQSYYDMHYTPANMSVVGVGGMALSELAEVLSESPFAVSEEGTRTPLPTPTSDVAPPSETRYVFDMSKQLTAPIEVIGSYRSVAKIPGNVNARAIDIMEYMFDEVLNEEVREKRAWAYAVNSSQRDLQHFHDFSIRCGGLALETIDEIEKIIEDCIISVKDREDLFKQTRRYILASSLMADLTGRGVCDKALNNLAYHQRIIPLAEYRNDTERVTIGDVRDLFQWLRPDRRWTLILKP